MSTSITVVGEAVNGGLTFTTHTFSSRFTATILGPLIIFLTRALSDVKNRLREIGMITGLLASIIPKFIMTMIPAVTITLVIAGIIYGVIKIVNGETTFIPTEHPVTPVRRRRRNSMQILVDGD